MTHQTYVFKYFSISDAHLQYVESFLGRSREKRVRLAGKHLPYSRGHWHQSYIEQSVFTEFFWRFPLSTRPLGQDSAPHDIEAYLYSSGKRCLKDSSEAGLYVYVLPIGSYAHHTIEDWLAKRINAPSFKLSLAK